MSKFQLDILHCNAIRLIHYEISLECYACKYSQIKN